MRDNKTLQLAYRVTPERRKQLRQWAINHETTFQDMVEKALDSLLNSVLESSESQPKKVSKKMNIVLEGQRRLVHNMPNEPVGQPDDQWKNAPWGEWAEMVLFSGIEGAATGLGSNIEWFLGNLGAKQLIDKLEKGGATNATDPDAPDYTTAATACEEAARQLRRYFAAKWKTASETTEDSDDT